jgi:dihydropteroate synthase
LLEEGADILDIGGESSRPGAHGVTEEEEIRRVIPLVREIKKTFPQAVVSLDTRRAAVARQGLDLGVDIINDISAGRYDDEMLALLGRYSASLVLMHMQGEPGTMQNSPRYENVVDEIGDFFEQRIKSCLESGIERHRLILDPGIGFGKTKEHNFEILAHLSRWRKLGAPLLIGLSMKSLLGGEVADRLPGSLALNLWSVLQGAKIVRVHHVRETRAALAALANVLNFAGEMT